MVRFFSETFGNHRKPSETVGDREEPSQTFENHHKLSKNKPLGGQRVRSRVIRSCDREIMRSWGRSMILGSLYPSFRAIGAPLQGSPWLFLPLRISRPPKATLTPPKATLTPQKKKQNYGKQHRFLNGIWLAKRSRKPPKMTPKT